MNTTTQVLSIIAVLAATATYLMAWALCAVASDWRDQSELSEPGNSD